MSQEVIDFIEALKEPWQGELATNLRTVVHQAIPDVLERNQTRSSSYAYNGRAETRCA